MKRCMYKLDKTLKNWFILIYSLKRTNSYEIEHVNAEAINLNQHNEDEALLKLTYYDRKAVTHWSNEIIAETSCSLQVNSLEDMVAGSHHFTHCMTVCGMHLTIISPVNVPRNGEQGLKQQIQNKDIYEAYPHPDKPIGYNAVRSTDQRYLRI